MYAHQVIEDLKKVSKIYGLDVNQEIEEIKSCINFHVYDFNNTIEKFNGMKSENIFNNSFSDYLKFPFNKIWLDWEKTKDEYDDVLSTGVYCNKYRELILIKFFSKGKTQDGSITPFIPSLGTYLIKNNGKFTNEDLDYLRTGVEIVDDEGFKVNIEDANVLLSYNPWYSKLKKVVGENEANKFLSHEKLIANGVFVFLQSFLLLLNCKNISTEKNYPPEALNKKRIKQGKQPLFTYHTLVVNPIGDKKRSNGEHEPTGIKQRLHFCRGHFKEYTESNKLFGKHTGLYWWQPMVRGNKELGLVHKDYEVRVA